MHKNKINNQFDEDEEEEEKNSIQKQKHIRNSIK